MKSRLLRSLCLSFWVMLLLAPGVRAQQAPDFEGVQKNILERLAEGHFIGIGIAYVHADGEVQYISRGALSEDRARSIEQNTIFEIGSVSKTFTALLMMKMAEEGLFALDTPVQSLLPDSIRVPDYEGEPIRMRHLATHTSGLPRLPSNLNIDDPTNPYANYTVRDMLAFLDDYELPRKPGAQYEYSNYGMGLLGYLLEQAAGERYGELLQQYITGPFQMSDTGIRVPEASMDRFARPYNFGDAVDYWDLPALAGAGAIRSTPRDMATYVKAQLGLQVSDLESAIEQTHERRFDLPAGGRADGIGLGWFITTRHDTIHWHTGGTGGFRSFAGINKSDGTGVVVLTNGSDDIGDIGMHLLDSRYPLTQVRATAEVDSAVLESYTGTYSNAMGLQFYVSRSGDELWVQLSGQGQNRVYPASENRFFYKVVEAEIEFSGDSAGRATQLTLFQNGQQITAARTSDATAPVQPEIAEVDPSVLEKYTGTYQLAPAFNIVITKEGDQLMAQATGQQKFPIYPESDTLFFLKAIDAKVEFLQGEDGTYNRLKLYQGGRVVEGSRVQ